MVCGGVGAGAGGGVGGEGEARARGPQRVPHGLVAPPVEAAEGDVAPHGEGEAAPEAGVALREDHFLQAGEGGAEHAGAGAVA